MGYTATYPRPEKTHPTAKNRVWGFFGNSNKSRPANRLQPSQPRREIDPTATKLVSGVFFYGYRFYDPVTGRWPSRDPIGERGGLNVYGFIQNTPTNFIDVLGLEKALTKHTVKDCEIYYYIGHSVKGKPNKWTLPKGKCYTAFALSCQPNQNNDGIPEENQPSNMPNHHELLYLNDSQTSQGAAAGAGLRPELESDDNVFPRIVKRLLSPAAMGKEIANLCKCKRSEVLIRIRFQEDSDFADLVEELDQNGMLGIEDAFEDNKEYRQKVNCPKSGP